MLFPFLGWPIALGYRKIVIFHLNKGRSTVLPNWQGNRFTFWLEGWKAIAVIFVYLLPVTIWFWVVLFVNGFPADFPWVELLLFNFAFLLFSPLVLPGVLLALHILYQDLYFSLPHLTAIFGLFVLIIFLIPGGFLQVSRTGRYLSAFDLPRAVRIIISNFRNYLEAWIYSGIVSFAGHLCLPFSPWGIFWCYQSIVYSFNEVRFLSELPEDRDFKSGSWFARLRERNGLD